MVHEELVRAILSCIGGQGNVVYANNCMTRLRITLVDDSLVNEADLRAVDGVMGIVHDRPLHLEVVVGPGAARKCADVCARMGIPAHPPQVDGGLTTGDWRGNKETIEARQGSSRVKSALKTFGEIFVPLIPGVIAAGLCSGLAALVAQLVDDYQTIVFWDSVYTLLSMVAFALLSYITAWAGYRAAERFGGTPILGGMLGMITSLDGINTISQNLGLYNTDIPLDSILMSGRGGVLAAVLGAFILVKMEQAIRRKMPDSLDVVFTPVLSLLLTAIPYIFVIMPLCGFISDGLCTIVAQTCMSDNVIVRVITGYVTSALFLPLVAMGMHHGLIALYTVELTQLGYVTLYPALAMAGAGQVGAAIAIYLKAKSLGNERLRSVIAGALPAGFLGIGEPLIYGVTLPMGRPFLTAGLGAGFGGAFVMAMQVAAETWGASGLLGLFVMTKGPSGAVASDLCYLIGLVVSYVMGFIITRVTIKPADVMSVYAGDGAGQAAGQAARQVAGQTAQKAGAGRASGSAKPKAHDADAPGPASATSASQENSLANVLYAPLSGAVVDMAHVDDPVFAGNVMGSGIAIVPFGTQVTVLAPASGVLTALFPTGHAFGITTPDGAELMVHVGIDTVKAEGQGFTLLGKRQGDAVAAGDSIVQVDLARLAATYDMTTMLVVVNGSNASAAFTTARSVQAGEAVATIACSDVPAVPAR